MDPRDSVQAYVESLFMDPFVPELDFSMSELEEAGLLSSNDPAAAHQAQTASEPASGHWSNAKVLDYLTSATNDFTDTNDCCHTYPSTSQPLVDQEAPASPQELQQEQEQETRGSDPENISSPKSSPQETEHQTRCYERLGPSTDKKHANREYQKRFRALHKLVCVVLLCIPEMLLLETQA